MRLVTLEPKGDVIFVGDTHGDLEASKRVISKYMKRDNKIVFLGDYVDRGEYSKENIDFLLELRKQNPKRIYLLLGNHDAYGILRCHPANFWESLVAEEKKKYFSIFEKFPLAISIGKIIALHRVLPDTEKISDINKISDRDEHWMQILWGDFQDRKGKYLGEDYQTGRPQFGKGYFDEIMKRFGKNILIRSHQPNAPEKMFDKRCLTIFTSSAYGRKRTVAIADFSKRKEIKTVDDLVIEEI